MKLPTHLAVSFGFLFLIANLSSVLAEPSQPFIVGLAEAKKSNNFSSSSNEARQNRTIVTEPRTVEELKLSNSTILALGEGAMINLNKQSNTDTQTNVGTVVSLEKGPFRIINSSEDKKNLKIRTPNLLVATELSVLDLYIAPNGSEYLLLHSGTTKVCKRNDTKSSSCRILNTPCDLIRVSPGGKISQSLSWSDRTTELELTFSETFPFILTPPRSDPVVYHSRLGVEENKCGPTSLANNNSLSHRVNETGALPEPAPTTIKTPLENRESNQVSLLKPKISPQQVKEQVAITEQALTPIKSAVEKNESSPTSLTKQPLPLQQLKETGALPESGSSTTNLSLEKNKTTKKSTIEKLSSTSSKNVTCIQCSNDEKADKYWTKIIRQAQNHVSIWWNSLNQPKKHKS